ncbi:hypothetical protein ACEK07_06830 [Alcanivoracaceae bacterium MT1]
MGECIYCHGDGMDPDNDFLLPCPYCDGTGGELLGCDDDWMDDDGESEPHQGRGGGK